MMIGKKRLLLILFFALAVVLLLLATLPEDNEGTPSQRTDEKNCGMGLLACHKNDTDSTLTVETAANSEDHKLFVAPIYKDGEKLKDTEFQNQAKAVAVDSTSDFINSLDTSDNEDELNLTSHGPTNGEKFWIGFGYKDEFDTIHVNSQDEAYTYEKENTPPVPKAKISIESGFPDDVDKTIEISEGDDGKTLSTALTKDGKTTIYFTGRDSTDDDPGDELVYYWDIDGDGEFEDGNGTGDDLDERGENYVFNYTEAKTYNLKFKVADGTAESTSLSFTIEIAETEEKPELHPLDIVVEDENGDPATEFEKGDTIELSVEVENKDDSGYGADTAAAVSVKFYYARGEESYNTWHELEATDTGSKIIDNGKARVSYTWDTTSFDPDGYKIKVVVDEADAVNEWDEGNNEETFDTIIDIEDTAQQGNPIVTFSGDIIFDYVGEKLKENTDVTVDVSIQNTGDGEAKNARVHFYIDNIKKASSPYFDLGVAETKKLSELAQTFPWSPSTAGGYDIKLELEYFDSQNVEHKETKESIDVQVEQAATGGNGGGNGGGQQKVDEGDGGGFLPGFEVLTAVAVVAAVALVFARKKRL